jgi:hypothetical protein
MFSINGGTFIFYYTNRDWYFSHIVVFANQTKYFKLQAQ